MTNNVDRFWETAALDSSIPVMKRVEALCRRIKSPTYDNTGSELLNEWRKKSKVKFMKNYNEGQKA